MAEKSYFFDSTEDDKRIYQAADFARFHAQIIGNGVSNTASLPDLKVSATTNMDVSLGAGYMFANGYMYENSDGLKLKHDIADPDNDRIDRVVVRFDNNPEERKIYAVVKKGVPAGKPTPPSVTRDGYIYEMSVAQVRVRAGKSYVDDDDIMDERANDAVCGYIPLHNIYRGLQINERGMVSMPNQSYVEVDSDESFDTPDRERVHFPLLPLKIDRQNEVTGKYEFTAKSSGAYTIFAYLAFSEDEMKGGSDVQLLFNINGKGQGPITARVSVNNRDNVFSGSTVQYLEKGDKLTIDVLIYGAPDNFKSRNHRVRIAKIN